MIGTGEFPQSPQRELLDVRVLEAIADARPLPEILGLIAERLEELVRGWRVSVLLLSPDGATLRHGAAPSLPQAYIDGIDGSPIGPIHGSCGTAAYRRETVIVEDIAQDPLWVPWRALALAHGLRACWSVPVIDHHGVVLATFAAYHAQPTRPEQAHLELLHRFAHLARIAIQHDRAQQHLRASEEWFRSVFRDAAFGLVVADRDGRLTYTNRAYRQMLGYSEEELRTLRVADLTHPEDRDANSALLRDVIDGKRPSFVLEKRYLAKGGRCLWVRATVSARHDANGRVADVIGIAEDISQRRADEDERREQQQLLQMASRVGRLGAWSLDVPSMQPHLSPEALAIHEADGDTAADPRLVVSQYDPEHLRLLRAAVAECSQHGVPFDLEARLTTARGNLRWVRLIGEAVRDAGGAIVRVQGALQDITDRKQLEQQSLRSQRLESIGTLAGGIAHDLNNVLTPIAMGVELLKVGERDAARLQLLDLVQASGARAADMVRQVLAFARGTEGRRESIAPVLLVRDVAALLTDTLPKRIRLELDVAAAVPTVDVDPTQIHQVLLNLCVNARDAMPDGGRLRMCVQPASAAGPGGERPTAAEVRITVEDTGEGIPPEVVDKIFDPFFTTKPTGQGTGLGLSTSLGIVRSHGGRIEVASVPGQGSRFDVVLPASPGERQPPATAAAQATAPNAQGTVLLVDDEKAVRMVARHALLAAGYRVIEAATGDDALDMYGAHAGEVVAVLTDMMMPGMDGTTFVHRLRMIAPELPIVGMSGLGAERAGPAESSGLTAFIAKPFTPSALRAVLQAAISARDGH